MAAILDTPVVLPPIVDEPSDRVQLVAVPDVDHDPDPYWHSFARQLAWIGPLIALFLFWGPLALTVAAGGGWIGGAAIGGMCALWGTPCFGVIFAANVGVVD